MIYRGKCKILLIEGWVQRTLILLDYVMAGNVYKMSKRWKLSKNVWSGNINDVSNKWGTVLKTSYWQDGCPIKLPVTMVMFYIYTVQLGTH